MEQVILSTDRLLDLAKAILGRFGLPATDAGIVAEVLLWANTRGIDSHGVLRLPSYLAHVRSGRMNPQPRIRVEVETDAVALMDADLAFGPVATVRATDIATSKARKVGIGLVLIREVSHQGAMGYYALRAARRQMAGLAIACTGRNMVPYGARVAGLHNSPIAIAVPARRHGSLLLDMATSVAAQGRIWLAADRGQPIPETWAVDEKGEPTTRPEAVAALLPSGGYKGSGLALMFQCLTSLMVGNPLLGYGGALEAEHLSRANSLVAAVDIGTFTDVQDFEADVDTLVEGVKSLPRADGVAEILVPGEYERRVSQGRAQDGIPLPQGTIQGLREVAEEVGVELPPELRSG